jgi:RNA-directed DNA polymerase
MENLVFVDILEGFPQGGPISPLLCNIALTGIVEKAATVENPRPVTVRYADDFVILTRSREGANKAKQVVGEFLKTRGLEFKNSCDPDIVHITEGFDFLGCTFKRMANYGFDKNLVIRKPKYDENRSLIIPPFWDETEVNGQKKSFVLCKPSVNNVNNIKLRIKNQFLLHSGASIGSLILKLNPIIRGYANLIRTVNCTQTFRELDNYIFRLTKRYFRRKHPNKSKKWIDNRYFTSLYGFGKQDNWVLTDPDSGYFLLKFRYF